MDTQIIKKVSVINRASVKRYALYVAASSRAHKFTRVSQEFINDVEARVESTIRRIGIAVTAPIQTKDKLTTRLTVDKFKEVIEMHARAVVCEKVRIMPSAGKTLV
jgi:menaquinone-dependent protoporphyrinogen IX oxidase